MPRRPAPPMSPDDWFAARGWTVFPFQRDAWAAYAAGHSGLIHAATGTGKTLAAWLGPVREWLAENPDPAARAAPGLRVLWLTPLKALAGDTCESLLAPLRDLKIPWTVETRTGDTKASVRTRQRTKLPAALITTPESLTLMLTHADAREKFADLRCVVVDEWHELLGSKRGVQAELAMARLRAWRPTLRTWGLSATLGNIDVALRALVGVGDTRRVTGDGDSNTPLTLTLSPEAGARGHLIRGHVPKSVVIDTVLPPDIERFPWAGHLGFPLLPHVVAAVEEGQTALVFTNTRSQTELWYQEILKARPDWAGCIALHHGSLDRKVRAFVEAGLKDGSLRCVVCTSSLDLGVDFTPVDRVIQIGSPKGIARLLQRAGRSGHRPGVASRVTVVPTNALELVEVAAARDAAAAGRIEGRTPAQKPLDVLAQHCVTVALGGGFDAQELLAEVRTTACYEHLTDAEWLWVLDFVVRGGESLRAYPEFRRVVFEDGLFRVTDSATARRHRTAVGTIVGDGHIAVRYLKGGTLGTVEETFVSRLNPGDTFVFAGKLLAFVRVRDMTAWVRAAKKAKGAVPRWMGGRMPLSSELAAAVRGKLAEARRGEYYGPEMQCVKPVLETQRRRSAIPAAHEFLIERVTTREGFHIFCYPFEGRFVHEGLAALAAVRLGRRTPISFSIAVNDYGFELLSADEPPFEAALRDGLFSPDNLVADIEASLNAAEMGARAFREIARVAGLVHPGMPGGNKSAKQLQATAGLFYRVFCEYDPDNLLLRQARREVLEKQLEEARLRAALDRLSRAELVLLAPDRPTPLAFPLLVDRLRAGLSTETLADRVRKLQAATFAGGA